jgi:hypothetical protein
MHIPEFEKPTISESQFGEPTMSEPQFENDGTTFTMRVQALWVVKNCRILPKKDLL